MRASAGLLAWGLITGLGTGVGLTTDAATGQGDHDQAAAPAEGEGPGRSDPDGDHQSIAIAEKGQRRRLSQASRLFLVPQPGCAGRGTGAGPAARVRD